MLIVDTGSFSKSCFFSEPSATWDQENVNKLIQRVMIISKANKMDDTPFTKHTIDWKEVSFGDFTAHACSVKWEKMLMSVITVN